MAEPPLTPERPTLSRIARRILTLISSLTIALLLIFVIPPLRGISLFPRAIPMHRSKCIIVPLTPSADGVPSVNFSALGMVTSSSGVTPDADGQSHTVICIQH